MTNEVGRFDKFYLEKARICFIMVPLYRKPKLRSKNLSTRINPHGRNY